MDTNPKNKTQLETPETLTLISRKQLSTRWGCCVMTLKRREHDGSLKAIRFNSRMLRYRLSDVLAIEAAAGAQE